MCNLFTISEEIDLTSYADDKKRFLPEATPPENVVRSLESCSTSLF